MKIDKNCKAPKPRLQKKQTLISMEIGDSIFEPNCNTATSTWYDSAKKMKKRAGMIFVGRSENNGVRIWRVG